MGDYWLLGWDGLVNNPRCFVGFLKKGCLRLDIYQCNLFLEKYVFFSWRSVRESVTWGRSLVALLIFCASDLMRWNVGLPSFVVIRLDSSS